METNTFHAKINSRWVQGHAYLQPKPDYWTGIFRVANDLFDTRIEDWESIIVEYEGPFQSDKECVHGTGKAEIVYVSPGTERHVHIHLQGIEKPQLQNLTGEETPAADKVRVTDK